MDVFADTDFREGTMLLVNKPGEWTSFDVVNKIRYCLKRKLGVKKIKVGHAGTLDPMATGLLIICTGKWTKRLSDFQDLDKYYSGTMVLGAATASYDAETPVSEHFPTDHIDKALIEKTRRMFLGSIMQTPPLYSALKVDGKPLYQYARKGRKVEIAPRPVHIHAFQVLRYDPPELDFEVHCSKGTYIRSLAHDFGTALGSGAYLSRLCRTQIGTYHLEDAWELKDLIRTIDRVNDAS